jgi:hypothetical protein
MDQPTTPIPQTNLEQVQQTTQNNLKKHIISSLIKIQSRTKYS